MLSQFPIGSTSGSSPNGESPQQPNLGHKIKWGSSTRILTSRPGIWKDAIPKIIPLETAPSAHDVMIGRVVEIRRHQGIELDSGRKSRLYPNDLVGVTFGHRYATRQYAGEVPGLQPLYDMLSQGGVCGRVISAANHMEEPTLIEPLGYLVDDHGEIVNLKKFGVQKKSDTPHVRTILVVGSSMDAGKTYTVSSIIRGLTSSGKRVNAGKLTGTACAKDTFRMLDAGASKVLDFNDAGYCSTFRSTEQELTHISESLISNLSENSPDYIVLEIADGIIQSETQFLLSYLVGEQHVDHICVAVHDALSGPSCLEMLRRNWGIEATLISGLVTRSPLSILEIAGLVDIPCVSAEELGQEDVEEFFLGRKNQSEECDPSTRSQEHCIPMCVGES